MRASSFFALILVVVVTIWPATADAQRRTLFDLLFGERDNQQTQQQPAQQEPQRNTQTQQVTRPAAPSPSVTVVATPQVDKNEGATRLMVFGDSLAVDLAKAMERSFAEDPNLIVLNKGVGSSGFVRDDFYDWNAALKAELETDSFDMAVVIIGINDRQALARNQPLTDEWKSIYSERLNSFLSDLRAAGKPVIWVGLPPMKARSYSQAINEISSLHRLASVSNNAEFVDIYERFTDEEGNYTSQGPDLNGQMVTMRKNDGIHFSTAGSDKVAFYVSQAMRTYYQGGSVSLEVADLLAGTDAAEMVRLPFQGQGQVRLLEIAGAILPLTGNQERATELVTALPETDLQPPFTLEDIVAAPIGRADAFGAGIIPGEPEDEAEAQ